MWWILILLLLAHALGTCGCAGALRPGTQDPRQGDEIAVCGRFVSIGTRVVLWNDPGGYDAYREERHFEPGVVPPRDDPGCTARYGRRRGLADESPSSLRGKVDRVIIHYDAAGTSRRCFEILHDVRGLSCHFLLDVDGTVYQTLDVKERAWHAGSENDRSVGIEIANLGAYPERSKLVALGEDRAGETGVPVCGEIGGVLLWQYGFTEAQYEALGMLVAALCRTLDVPASAPMGPDGAVRSEILLPEPGDSGFPGILGHYHVSTSKVDPGPAFRWDRLLRDLHLQGVR